MDAYSQDAWTEGQWTQVREAVRDEAKKQRVAASFLPLAGPLPEDAQVTTLQEFVDAGDVLQINDHTTRRLTTLSVHVALRSAQVAEPDLSTALVAFRRAANLIARTEDLLIFQGQPAPAQPPPSPDVNLKPCNVTGGEQFPGLLTVALAPGRQYVQVQDGPVEPSGEALVEAVSKGVSFLEQNGHLGPFALALGSLLFDTAQTPNNSLVLPADRIKPMLDGPLVRSSTLNMFILNRNGKAQQSASGILVALGGNLIDLVVASEIDVQFLQKTADASPRCIYRVSERFTLRIKQSTAVVALG
jgi:uncharacterized linocin/CFP29 family protein